MKAAAMGDIHMCLVLSRAPAGMEETQVMQDLLLEFPVKTPEQQRVAFPALVSVMGLKEEVTPGTKMSWGKESAFGEHPLFNCF